uniref:Beta-defensin-like domain-containing protein n=1 Tax=Salvator merianae TaxID=96440 RepID=A0A8D0B8E5_SALMN
IKYLCNKLMLCLLWIGFAQPPPALEDTVACHNSGGFCRPVGLCPTNFSPSGACHGENLICCKK